MEGTLVNQLVSCFLWIFALLPWEGLRAECHSHLHLLLCIREINTPCSPPSPVLHPSLPSIQRTAQGKPLPSLYPRCSPACYSCPCCTGRRTATRLPQLGWQRSKHPHRGVIRISRPPWPGKEQTGPSGAEHSRTSLRRVVPPVWRWQRHGGFKGAKWDGAWATPVTCICGQSRTPLTAISAISLWERAMREPWLHSSSRGHEGLHPPRRNYKLPEVAEGPPGQGPWKQLLRNQIKHFVRGLTEPSAVPLFWDFFYLLSWIHYFLDPFN